MVSPIPRRAEPDALNPALIQRLSELLGESFSRSIAEREQHGRGESYHPVQPPDAVCYAGSTEEVAAIVRLCNEYRTPIIAFGAGTSLEGHLSALHGGISLDLSRMNKIIEVRPGDLDASVQAGVTREQLNTYLRDQGLFFPIDPGAECTLGGMAATRASGTNAVRYGTMRENVVSLTVVLADGRVIRTASRARKSSAGYDLTRLLVGSEGTLGIITELTVRLYGIPEVVSAAVCNFDTVRNAVTAVSTIIQCGVPIARVELLDANTLRAVNKFSNLDYAEQPTLFFEFHGSAQGVREQAELTQSITADLGGRDFQWTTSAEGRSALWRARHNVHYALQAMRPSARIWSTDVCVPISALPDCIEESAADVAGASFFVGMVGHVGDGNFHLGLVINPDNPDEMAEANGINERVVMRALALGGTCTGEHGVGYGKSEFLPIELGTDALDVMRSIKAALDPNGILNPGKILS